MCRDLETVVDTMRDIYKHLHTCIYIPHLLQVSLFWYVHGVVDEEGAKENCGNQEFGSEGFVSFSFQCPSALRV